jgi:hypothetical protein
MGGDGIRWLADREWIPSVLFARGIGPQELAVRMGGDRDGATEPITNSEAWNLGEWYRPGDYGDGVVRVGESQGWSFALEYGDSTGSELRGEISGGGVEVVHYLPMPDHPPALVFYARDGVTLCGFGLGEENVRWGQDPDLLLPDLTAGQVTQPDGSTLRPPEDEHYTVTYRRTLDIIEQRFGLSLPPSCLEDARLPAYAVRGEPNMDI